MRQVAAALALLLPLALRRWPRSRAAPAISAS